MSFARNRAESENPSLWTGLVADYRVYEGPTGETLHDWGGRRNNGTLTNMVPATDWVRGDPRPGGWALDFDGGNDHVRITSIGALDTGYPLSVMALCNVDNIVGTDTIISVSDFSLGDRYFELAYDNFAGQGVRFVVRSTGSGFHPATAGDLVSGWNVFVGIAPSSASRSIYVNGILRNTNVVNVPWPTDLDVGTIGAMSRNGVWAEITRYQGPISVVSVWNRVLAPSEIQHLYRVPHALSELRRRVFPAAVAAFARPKVYGSLAHGRVGLVA